MFIMLNQMSRRLAAQKDTGLRRDTGGGEEAGSERIGGKPEPAASENGFHALQGGGKGSRGEERMDRLEEEVRPALSSLFHAQCGFECCSRSR